MRTGSHERTQHVTAPHVDRQSDLRRLLEDRRREISADLQERVKDVRRRATSRDTVDVVDMAESAEADIQDELHLALLQMKAETLERIEQALMRLDSGQYGRCVECDVEITERRLRALPFALRCTECEEAREFRTRQQRKVPPRFPGSSFGSL